MRLGLRFVHQELSLCLNLRVYENFAIELPDIIRGLGWKLARHRPWRKPRSTMCFPATGIDPRAKVGALSLSQQQMVEIARAASHPAVKLLILDEPTSSLGSREAVQLRGLHQAAPRRRYLFHLHFASPAGVARRRRPHRRDAQRQGGVDRRHDHSISHDRVASSSSAAASGANCRAGRRCRRDERRWFRSHGLRDGVLQRRQLHSRPRRNRRACGSGRRRAAGGAALGFRSARMVSGKDVTVRGRVAFVSGDRATEGIFPLWSIDENIAASSLRRLARWGLISTVTSGCRHVGMVRQAQDPRPVRVVRSRR